MPYELNWDVPETVLRVKLINHVSLEEFIEIDGQVTNHLNQRESSNPAALLLDTRDMQSMPQTISQLKASQTYANRHDIKYLLVIGKNKLTRLMMLLTLNPSRPYLHFIDDEASAWLFLKRQHLDIPA